jgi:hypothetical protein
LHVQTPEEWPALVAAVHVFPLVQASPQTPQFAASVVRFLQAVAFAAVEQHTVPTPLQALCRQSGSAQSTNPSQSSSTPSPQVVSVAPVGVHEQVALAPLPVQVELPTHAAWVPHRQAPPVHRLALVALQAVQVAPAVPQAAVVGVATQVLPLQQPAQVVGSQTQVPAWHFCPVPHFAAPPQVHTPAALQPSAWVALQAEHAAAPVPQLAVVGGVVQVVPEQQPVLQLVESHTHEPDTQCWPAAHTAPLPHLQAPPAQVSARTGSHALHWAPAVPHCAAVVAVTQLEPLQQPLGQLAAVQPAHTWLVQVCPLHDAQVVPPMPHWVLLVPVWQVLFASQHPPAQLVASHTHAPPTQRCPAAHAAPVPHAQAPEVQRSAVAVHALQVEAAAPQAVGPCAEGATHWLP